MVNELILNAVKEASKSHADLPDYEERCIEHVEKLEEFMTKMLTTSWQAKEPCPGKNEFMTQDIHVINIESIAEELNKITYQIVRKALKEFDEGKERQED